MKTITKILTAVVLGLSLFVVAFPAQAAYACDLPAGGKGYIQSDGRTCCPKPDQKPEACLYDKYINPFIQLLSAAVGLVIVTAIIHGAIEFITSAGDAQRSAAGRKRITEALIGLVAFVLLYAVLVFLVPGGFLNG